MTMHRRDLLKAGIASLPFLSLSQSVRAIGAAVASRPRTTSDARALFIYLRGGADPLNMLVPMEDPDYPMLRPAVGLNLASLLPYQFYNSLGFNSALRQLRAIPQEKVAYLYRTGNKQGERSHFTEQHLTETGRTQFGGADAGWVPQVHQRSSQSSTLGIMSLSSRLQRTMLATDPLNHTSPLHLQTAYSLATGMNTPRDLTIDYGIGSTLGIEVAVRDSVSKSLTNPQYPQSADATYLRNTVDAAGASLLDLRSDLSMFGHDVSFPVKVGNTYDPIPANSGMSQDDIKKGTPFFARLEEAVNLLTVQGTNPPLANCAAVELGGWDTHSNQIGNQEALMRILGQGLKASYDRLSADSQPFLIYVVTEFGRTVKDNGGGTDHGVGGMTIAIGSAVKGGVWNAYSPTWSATIDANRVRGQAWKGLAGEYNGTGGVPNLHADALDPVTDFRLPLAEICENYFGVPVANLPAPLSTEWANVLTAGKLGFL